MKVKIIKANGVKEFDKEFYLEELAKVIQKSIDDSMDTSIKANRTSEDFHTYSDTGNDLNKINYSYSSSASNGPFMHLYSITS